VVLLGALHVGHEGEQQAAVVGGVLAEGELAVDFDVVDGGEGAVLVDEAVGAAVKFLRSSGGPPVARLPWASNLRPSSSKPWVSSWPMMAPMWP
jgi:hypothetical protein